MGVDTLAARQALGAKIRAGRRKYEISGKRFAAVLGIGVTTLWRWEAGEQTPNVLQYKAITELFRTEKEKRVP